MTYRRSWRIILPIATVFAFFCLAGTAPAQSARTAGNAALIRDIENNLIAPCCWNQPISEHPSEVSDRMRAEVRMMVAQGKSRDEILDHYVAEYGERILATPRAQGVNVLAYIAPWAALVLGGWGLFLLLGKRRAPVPAGTMASVAVAAPSPAKHPAARPANYYTDLLEKELRELDD